MMSSDAILAVDEEFEIRPAGPNDHGPLLALMAKIYRGDCAARYQRLYRSNPHGVALTWLAIERESGEAVGCTSLFPRRMRVLGRERHGSIGGDCFVEPRVRRRGLAVALHRASFAQMRAAGVDFMYGPPVPNNLAALLKAGSSLVGDYGRWVRPLNGRAAFRGAFSRQPGPFVARMSGLPLRMLDCLRRVPVRGYTLDEAPSFGNEFDDFFERASATHTIACVRDHAYLEWRYSSGPARRQIALALRREGALVGFVAMEIDGERGALVDVFTAADHDSTDVALCLALDYAAARGCASVDVSATERSPVARRLGRFGCILRSARGFQVAVNPRDTQARVLLTADSWHLMEADKDLDTVFASDAQPTP